jgi:hypothetical protein
VKRNHESMTSEDGIGMYLSVSSVRVTVKDTSGVVRETVEIQVGAVTQITSIHLVQSRVT